jgi:hypothetical protein
MNNWRKQDGVILLRVTSDGTTGPIWIERLEKKSFEIDFHAKDVLRSDSFRPTFGRTVEVAILDGVIPRHNFTRGESVSAAEVACLIRDKFSNEDIEAMGLFTIVVLGDSPFLQITRYGRNGSLDGASDDLDCLWKAPSNGFAYVI